MFYALEAPSVGHYINEGKVLKYNFVGLKYTLSLSNSLLNTVGGTNIVSDIIVRLENQKKVNFRNYQLAAILDMFKHFHLLTCNRSINPFETSSDNRPIT